MYKKIKKFFSSHYQSIIITFTIFLFLINVKAILFFGLLLLLAFLLYKMYFSVPFFVMLVCIVLNFIFTKGKNKLKTILTGLLTILSVLTVSWFYSSAYIYMDSTQVIIKLLIGLIITLIYVLLIVLKMVMDIQKLKQTSLLSEISTSSVEEERYDSVIVEHSSLSIFSHIKRFILMNKILFIIGTILILLSCALKFYDSFQKNNRIDAIKNNIELAYKETLGVIPNVQVDREEHFSTASGYSHKYKIYFTQKSDETVQTYTKYSNNFNYLTSKDLEISVSESKWLQERLDNEILSFYEEKLNSYDLPYKLSIDETNSGNRFAISNIEVLNYSKKDYLSFIEKKISEKEIEVYIPRIEISDTPMNLGIIRSNYPIGTLLYFNAYSEFDGKFLQNDSIYTLSKKRTIDLVRNVSYTEKLDLGRF